MNPSQSHFLPSLSVFGPILPGHTQMTVYVNLPQDVTLPWHKLLIKTAKAGITRLLKWLHLARETIWRQKSFKSSFSLQMTPVPGPLPAFWQMALASYPHPFIWPAFSISLQNENSAARERARERGSNFKHPLAMRQNMLQPSSSSCSLYLLKRARSLISFMRVHLSKPSL